MQVINASTQTSLPERPVSRAEQSSPARFTTSSRRTDRKARSNSFAAFADGRFASAAPASGRRARDPCHLISLPCSSHHIGGPNALPGRFGDDANKHRQQFSEKEYRKLMGSIEKGTMTGKQRGNYRRKVFAAETSIRWRPYLWVCLVVCRPIARRGA